MGNLEKVYGAGETLLRLVNDLLDVSKVESGAFEIVPIKYDVPSVINDTAVVNMIHIREKPIRFVLDIDPSLPARLYGDELRVKQMISNLLSNAFKYTASGSVTLGVHGKADAADPTVYWLDVAVTDTGMGIKPDDIPHLFTAYTRADMRKNRKIMGTGLGLSLTKGLVEAMGGTIGVESKYGVGSTFLLHFKQEYVSGEPLRTIGTQVADNLSSFTYSDKKRQHSQKIMHTNLSYARVLVVDDVQTNLDVARGILRPYKMTVDCVLSGERAVALMRAGTPHYDAIFMDHMMPGIDGIQATKLIRETCGEYGRDIPVIALTANALRGNEKMFLDAGFQAFIAKPIDLGQMDVAVNEWVRNKKYESELAAAGGTAVNAAEEEAPLPPPFVIEGVEMGRLSEKMVGDASVVRSVLQSYAHNTAALLLQIAEPNYDDMDLYVTLVHGIKGSSYGICADGVGKKAEMLEKSAKASDFDFVKEHNDAFIAAAQTLIGNIQSVLDETKPPRDVLDKPDREALAALRDACTVFAMDEVDTLVEKLNASDYREDGDLIAWISDRVAQSAFKEIAERVEEYLNK
jgi:CheY-like chemotaxis protein